MEKRREYMAITCEFKDRTYNTNDNPKVYILMSGNIRQKRLKILEYFDAYICHHCQPKSLFEVDNDDKYMHRNIPEFLVFLSDIFRNKNVNFWIIICIICSVIIKKKRGF